LASGARQQTLFISSFDMEKDVHLFFKKLAWAGGLVALIYIVPALWFNGIIDPYGVFHPDASYHAAVPNERIIKMRHLLAHPTTYSTLILGNSRVNNLPDSGIPGHVYNFFLTGSTASEQIDDLRFLLDHGVTTTRIVLGVDESDYMVNPKDIGKYLSSIPYPKDGNFLPINATYLFTVPNAGVIDETFHSTEQIRYDYASSGHAFFDKREDMIQKDPHAEIARVELAILSPQHLSDHARIDTEIQAIRELKQLCDQRGIHLTIFTDPVSRRLFEIQDIDAYTEFLTRLAGVMPFTDFGGLNGYTQDLSNYYEYSHFRPLVGQAMNDILWGSATPTTDGFGVRVDPSNIQARVGILREQYASLHR
jgi:hypothetical protein